VATTNGSERPRVVDVAGLDAGYNGNPVVRDLTIHVFEAEVVALLGANGAGKTTTLSTIAGLQKPIAGRIRIDGIDVAGRPAHRLARTGLSLVPEGRALFAGLTARENLRLSAGRTRGRDRGHDDVLDLLPELRKCLDRKAGLLSGGEQQMLAVGRAIARRPRALLIDEMSLGLAPVVVERLLPVLRRVADELHTAVLLVEQHVSLALEIADRAYVMAHGRLVLGGPAAQLRTRRDLLKACYLGDLDQVTRLSGESGPDAAEPDAAGPDAAEPLGDGAAH
jgi:branched-chain amino acid transport system ATP-binding protein